MFKPACIYKIIPNGINKIIPSGFYNMIPTFANNNDKVICIELSNNNDNDFIIIN